jgi:hypothetical protein
MNPALAGVALAVIVGAIVAASARDARTAVLGLGVALTAAPAIADPITATTGMAARVVGAVLAIYLLWITVRDGEADTGGSSIGWVAEAALAAAAAVVGFDQHGLGAKGLGPAEAQAAGFALAALAVAPLITGRDVLRIGIGLLLLMQGALLVLVGLDGTPTAFAEIVTAVLIVGLGGAVAVLARAARQDGADGFALATDPRPTPRQPEGRLARRRARPSADSMPMFTPDAFTPEPVASDVPGADVP